MLLTLLGWLFILQGIVGIVVFEYAWKKIKFLREIDQNFEDKYPAFRRRDTWSKWRYYPFAPFFVIRFIFGISVVIMAYIFIK